MRSFLRQDDKFVSMHYWKKSSSIIQNLLGRPVYIWRKPKKKSAAEKIPQLIIYFRFTFTSNLPLLRRGLGGGFEDYFNNPSNTSTNLGSEGLGALGSRIFPLGSIKIKRGIPEIPNSLTKSEFQSPSARS